MVKVECFPLSQPQMRIWYTEKMYPNTTIGTVAGSMRVKENFDMGLLKESVLLLYRQSDTLRIKLCENDGYPSQFIKEDIPEHISRLYFKSNHDFEVWAEKEIEKPINIYGASLVEILLFKINESETGFFVKMHHVISDAWTMAKIGDKILENYYCLKNGQYPKNDIFSYKDYLASEEKFERSKRFEMSKNFWLRKFEVLPNNLSLPELSIGYNYSLKSKRLSYKLGDLLTNDILNFCEQNSLSVYNFFMSTLYIYFNKISSENDITLLTSTHNRNNNEDKNTLGMFISTTPFRMEILPEDNFLTLSNRLTREQISVYRHQKYPYNYIIQDIRDSHNVSIHNLSPVLFSYQNSKFLNKNYEYETKWYANLHQELPLVIHINDREDQGDLFIDFDYWADSFSEENIENIYKRLSQLINQVLNKPTEALKSKSVLLKSEKETILNTYNNTEIAFSKQKALPEIFEEQVEEDPSRIAISFGDDSLTYGELNERANQLAHVLRKKGVAPDTIVGIMMDRSIEMMVGILGIQKAGGAYLPINPDYPKERIAYVLKDSQANLLLTQEIFYHQVEWFEGEVISVDPEGFKEESIKNLPPQHDSSSLAYVIYTS
ncbi:condensation domain-containing protein, partial [Bacillus subtilis]